MISISCMKNYKRYIPILLLPALLYCKKNNSDNYPTADAELYGALLDAATDEPMQSEQPNGFKIRLLDQSYKNVIPIDFWGRADGTFQHTKVFSGTYKVIPMEMAAMNTDTQTLQIKGRVQAAFKVTPFLRINNLKIERDGNTITVHYSLSRSIFTTKIANRQLLVGKASAVSVNVNQLAVATNLLAIPDEQLLGVTFTDKITVPGPGVWYVRVAAATSNPLGKYNYSPIVKVEIP